MKSSEEFDFYEELMGADQVFDIGDDEDEDFESASGAVDIDRTFYPTLRVGHTEETARLIDSGRALTREEYYQ